jgi:pimeloyl-ACP methyl ester carboxylesterase
MNLFATILGFMIVMETKTFAAKRVQIGPFGSRALWTSVVQESGVKSPAIIMIPGSGPHGPECMIPGSMTADGLDHALLNQLASSFVDAGWNVLTLGKPGIEYFSNWDASSRFYNENLYMHMRWQDLIDNLSAGVAFLRAQPSVDPSKIYILGHSQGTQVAVDYAGTDEKIRGLILLGYSGEDIHSILEWQLYKRPIEHFFAKDVDRDRDGSISRAEAAAWPDPLSLDGVMFSWEFGANEILPYQAIEQQLRRDPQNKEFYELLRKSDFYSRGVFNRGPIYQKTSAVKAPIYIYTGELDLLTQPIEALNAASACHSVGKKNCTATIVAGLGHGFSAPRKPREHPLLDITVGPIALSFLDTLKALALRLRAED